MPGVNLKEGEYMNNQTLKDIDRAFKALEERDDVLDKIREEISDFEEEVFHRPNTDYSDYAAVRHCLEIIDKYREGELKK